MGVSRVYETIFRENQKVRVKKAVRNDGTFPGYKMGEILIQEGSEGYVREVSEFLFKPAIFVHFIEKNMIIGFREEELELVEDYDIETGRWVKVK